MTEKNYTREDIDKACIQAANRFNQFEFQVPDAPGEEKGRKMAYNLYVPENMQAGETYPLVLFIHDMGSCSEDVTRTLTQGKGATVWATSYWQNRQPCFVLAPCYPRQAADDDFQVTWEADATVELVKEVLRLQPSVDEKRIYGTGQSMGCMMLMELMLRNPGFFGGCFLVAGQWNPQTCGALKNENIWALVSEKDFKAFPIMGDCMKQIEVNGGRVTRGSLDAKASLPELNQKVRTIAGSGEHIFFTWFEGDSVLEELEDIKPWFYHMATWPQAYNLEAVGDWLFAQRRSPIDFSCKHHILLEHEDGSRQPMDVPFFQSKKIAPGTWQILSDGDYSYLVEGENEAFVIDSGYGCGNLRAYCQSLTDRPVKRIANTHDHFDHTANNSYFDCAYMSAETKKLATIPFPSFEGICFPRSYPVQVIDEGYVFDLGGRHLATFKIPDHAVGSLAFLDDQEGILFCGDELCMPFGKPVNGSVEYVHDLLLKLWKHKEEIKILYGGPGKGETRIIGQLLENMEYIMAGHEGEMMQPEPGKDAGKKAQGSEPVVYQRRLPHPPDRHHDDPADAAYKRIMNYAGICVIYDIRRVKEKNADDINM